MRRARIVAEPERRDTQRLRVRRARLRGHSLEARLVDFSRGGLGLETHTALRIGATYRFRLFAGRGRALAATVCWCRLRSTTRRANGEVLPIFRAGLRLVGSPTTPSPETEP